MLAPELVYAEGPVTPREWDVINNADFIEPYEDEVRELFVATGAAEAYTTDDEERCRYMERAWLGTDHLNGKGKVQLTPEQEAAAWSVIDATGHCRRVDPPKNTVVDDSAVIGATAFTNFDRSDQFRRSREELGFVTPSVRLWGGERARSAADGPVDDIIAAAFRDDPSAAEATPWAKRQAEFASSDPERALDTETALGRISLPRLVEGGGLLVPHRVNLAVTDLKDPHAGVPQAIAYAEDDVTKYTRPRNIVDYHYVAADGLDITVMNAPAVPRINGAPRHTTDSCTQEWARNYPIRQNGRLGLFVSGPYTFRMGLDIRRELNNAGRPDVQIVMAAAPMRRNMPIHAALGTFASLTRLDIRHNRNRR
jgi:hypothetical protein